MSHVFQTPEKILTGIGCFDQIGSVIAERGAHCLVVTGQSSMQKQGFLDKAIDLIEQQGGKVTVSDGVEHDPSLETVDRTRALCRHEACDVVLGLGGGSAIDVAKAVAGLSNCERPTRDFFDGQAIPGTHTPVIAAPSTFGTGTEATRVSVLTDGLRRLKKSIRHDCMLPKTALVDPVLGAHAPPELTAACGMDALTQAIESYLSIHATALTRAMSFNAIVLLTAGLPRAFRDGHDISARLACANASTMAGIALHNARLGLVHGLAHPLGAHYNLTHGAVCGTLLPYILEYNREAVSEDYKVLSGLFGDDAAHFCANLLATFGLPADLRHCHIPKSDFEKIADEVLPSGSTRANPRKVERAHILELLQAICL